NMQRWPSVSTEDLHLAKPHTLLAFTAAFMSVSKSQSTVAAAAMAQGPALVRFFALADLVFLEDWTV
ncbi:hypothetical protein, partial [Nocardioides malaquae]|uniref:hypothetical protein n=1 Tax=Nocardioides malaquae TaxID=2773426 RepID=UPI001D0D776A